MFKIKKEGRGEKEKEREPASKLWMLCKTSR